MNLKVYGLMTVAAAVTALIIFILLNVIGLPEGDLHPMITSALATISAIIVFQKMKSDDGSAASPSE